MREETDHVGLGKVPLHLSAQLDTRLESAISINPATDHVNYCPVSSFTPVDDLAPKIQPTLNPAVLHPPRNSQNPLCS